MFARHYIGAGQVAIVENGQEKVAQVGGKSQLTSGQANWTIDGSGPLGLEGNNDIESCMWHL